MTDSILARDQSSSRHWLTATSDIERTTSKIWLAISRLPWLLRFCCALHVGLPSASAFDYS